MMEMKAPGAGVSEPDLRAEDRGRTRVTATAYWHPAEVWGLVYWHALVPVYLLVFRGMTRAIARRAETAAEKRRDRATVGTV